MEGLGTSNEAAKYFFNGLDEEKARYYESIMTASPVLNSVLENDAYSVVPSIYLVAANDLAISAAYQEGMVALQNQRDGVDIQVLKYPGGHSPHLTWTKELVAEVKEFGEAVLG